MKYIPIFLGILFLGGCTVSCEDCVKVCEKTSEWTTVAKDKLVNYSSSIEINETKLNELIDRRAKCCYPTECQEAKNNPDMCTCVYMVQCTNET